MNGRIWIEGLGVAIATVALTACAGDRSPSPTAPPVPRSSPPPRVAPALAGDWTGPTRVARHDGDLPQCLPEFLKRGFRGDLDGEIVNVSRFQQVLRLREQAIGGDCYFDLKVDGVELSATAYGSTPWDYGGCVVALDTASWGCAGKASDVWTEDIEFQGVLTDSSQTRIHGQLRIHYRHRMRGATVDRRFTVTESFDLTKSTG